MSLNSGLASQVSLSNLELVVARLKNASGGETTFYILKTQADRLEAFNAANGTSYSIDGKGGTTIRWSRAGNIDEAWKIVKCLIS